MAREVPQLGPPPRPVPPATVPRRDLAGFLAERGLVLEAPEPVSGASGDNVTAGLAPPPISEPAALAELPESTLASDSVAGQERAGPDIASQVQTFPIVALDGKPLGAVTMRGDSVHLASLVGLLELKLPKAEFERLRTAPAADSFVPIASLREAGIDLALDDSGERIALAID